MWREFFYCLKNYEESRRRKDWMFSFQKTSTGARTIGESTRLSYLINSIIFFSSSALGMTNIAVERDRACGTRVSFRFNEYGSEKRIQLHSFLH